MLFNQNITKQEKQKNTTHKEKNNCSIETDLGPTLVLGLAGDDIKTVIITVFHVFKSNLETWEVFVELQIKLSEMKTTGSVIEIHC